MSSPDRRPNDRHVSVAATASGNLVESRFQGGLTSRAAPAAT
jgi:hypothetical protein